MGQIPHLNELRASFEDKGLRILAISSENEETLQPFIQEHRITYPVGILGSDSGYGTGGIPHAYLIAPTGKVVWDGHPASLNDSTIEKNLRGTKDFWIRDVHPDAKAAASAFKRGKLGDAQEVAKEVQGKEGVARAAVDDAGHVLERVAAVRAFYRGRADAAIEAGVYDEALDYLAKVEKHFAGGEDAAAATAKIKELKADPMVKKEISAGKKLKRFEDDIRKAGNSRKKLEAVEKRILKFMRKHEGMKVEARAKLLLRAINREKARSR